jgi:hypothetical protein
LIGPDPLKPKQWKGRETKPDIENEFIAKWNGRPITDITDIAEHAAEPTDPVVTTVDLQAYLEKRVNADGPSIPSTGSPSSADPALERVSQLSVPHPTRCFRGMRREIGKTGHVLVCTSHSRGQPKGQ